MPDDTQAAKGAASGSVRSEDDDMGYLSTAQVGAILGFQGRTIRAMCASGEIPAIEVSGEYRIEKRAFRDWLKTRTVAKPKTTPEGVAEAQ